MYHAKMQGVVTGRFPLVAITGTINKTASMLVEVTTAGLSGTAQVTVTDETASATALAATAITSGSAQALATGYGSLTITWAGSLPLGLKFRYKIFSDGTYLPAGFSTDAIQDFPGTLRDIAVDKDGNLQVVTDASAPLSVTPAVSSQRTKQQRITAMTAVQEVVLDNLIAFEMTNRTTSVMSFSTFGNEDGVAQVVTNTIASGVTLGGDLDVTVTAAGMTGSPKTITAAVLGTRQVETITCTAGESTGAGDITLTITAAGMTGSPEAVTVPVAASDSVDDVGLACRTALAANTNVAAFFTVSGADANVVLTAITAAANDAAMEIAFTDTDGTGVTFGSSTDTTAGVAPSTDEEVAEIVKDALNADGDIGGFFTAARSGAGVVLTADAAADNDTTMNLAVEEGTASGFTDSPTSANTTAGYAVGSWDELGNSATIQIQPPPGTRNTAPFTSLWIKSTADTKTVILRGWKEA